MKRQLSDQILAAKYFFITICIHTSRGESGGLYPQNAEYSSQTGACLKKGFL